MKNLILVTTCVLLSFIFAKAQNIDSLVNQRVDLGETPGIVVGLFEKGKIHYYTAGFANVETGEKATSKTLFEIGSITKTFTTLMLALMVNELKISLDDPAQKFMPIDIHLPDEAGVPIKIENLATARSGLPRMPDNFEPHDPANPYIDYTPAKLGEFLNHYQLTREPGSAYEYSNLGMGLLGYILTRASHETWSQLLQERVTNPLQMSQTFLNRADKKLSPLAIGYNGKDPVPAWTWTDESVMEGAGGIISNAEDMLLYLVTNLNEPSTPIGKAMAFTHRPLHDAGSETLQIGLGWHILNSNIVWHNGGTGGFRSFAGFNSTSKTAVIILTNSNTGADDLGFYILDHSSPLKKIVVPVTVDPKILTSYIGEYQLTPQFKVTITLKGNSLYCQATGQAALELFPESPTKFFLKVVDAKFDFVKAANGKVEKLILHQGGQDHDAVKVK